MRWIFVLVALLVCGIVSSTHAAEGDITLNVTLVLDPIEQSGLIDLYKTTCTQRAQAGQSVLAGCTATGDPPVCTCSTVTLNNYENAVETFTRNQLRNKHQNLIDKRANRFSEKYRTGTPEERTTLEVACPSCLE